ncbi:MAG TPA: sterol desaturase family protein [Stenomitos sp.]
MSESVLRLSCFAGVFVLMALWEQTAPCRPLSMPRLQRWLSHLGLAILNTGLLRVVLPLAAVGIAEIAQSRSWGLFNVLIVPQALAIVGSLIVLDFVIYGQHVLMHVVPWLWRLHQVHHADLDLDVTTAIRFHPAEMVLSMGLKMATVAILGMPPFAVATFEILLNASAMFNHSNIALPPKLEQGLKWILVTPNMHRIHHSIKPEESNRNFGFNLPWWDHWCGTYQAQPSEAHTTMPLGLAQYRSNTVERLGWMLLAPFQAKIQPDLQDF